MGKSLSITGACDISITSLICIFIYLIREVVPEYKTNIYYIHVYMNCIWKGIEYKASLINSNNILQIF